MTTGDPKTRETPTPYDWAGGAEPIERLLVTFYEKVPHDPAVHRLTLRVSPPSRSIVARANA